MQIIDNKALLLRVRHPEQITAVIPKSRQIDAHQVLVHWGLDEVRVLNNLRVKNVPSPIVGQYNWPGLFTPFEHQRATAAFLSANQKAFCFNEAGTGKSASVIWAADYLMNKGVIRRALIVCPLSIMHSVWRDEVFKTAMHRTVDVAYGTAEKRRKILAQGTDFVVVNYAGLEILETEIKNGGFDLIVVDEASHYKNTQSARWKCLNRIVQPNTWLWMLTGTPAAQSPMDAYGLAKLVNPKMVPRFAGAFRDMVMTRLTQFRWVPKTTAPKIVKQVLHPAIRFTKEECLDLPDMLYSTREVALTKQQQHYYDLLKKQMTIDASGEQVTAVNAAVHMNKLLQVAAGAAYSDGGNVVEFDIKNRFDALLEVIEEASHKVLVFVPFRNTITVLEEKLTAAGIGHGSVHGKVPVSERTRLFDRFQTEPDIQVLIIQPQTVAHGVTLTAANTVVWWGPVPSCETYEQANARVHRAGQRNPCMVIHLQGAPVERHIYGLLRQRIDVHSQIVDLYKNTIAE